MQPRHEVDVSSPSTAKVENVWHYMSAPLYDFMAWYFIEISTLSNLTLISASAILYTETVGIYVGFVTCCFIYMNFLLQKAPDLNYAFLYLIQYRRDGHWKVP
jgi:hypothetical protein